MEAREERSRALAVEFSIVVPTYHRPKRLRGCLESLSRVDAPTEGYEVIVVDDGSPEPLREVVLGFEDRLNVRYIQQVNGGPGLARNTGAEVAQGKWLVFVDDDCRPVRGWLTAFQAALALDPEALWGGRTENLLHRNAFSTASQVIVGMAMNHYNADPANALFLPSNNMAVCRASFLELGGFETQLFRYSSEDREFCDRWRHAGRRLRFEAKACVGHGHVLGCQSFCRQHFNYGRGAYWYQRVRRARRSGRMISDLGFHRRLLQMLRKHLGMVRYRPRACIAALLVVWQFCNAVGFGWEALTRRRGR